MAAIYMGAKGIKAEVGDVVLAPGNIRSIVIAVKDTFVTVMAIGTNFKTGDTFVLSPRFIKDFPANECHYMENQSLNLAPQPTT
jgi:hypothetical protein